MIGPRKTIVECLQYAPRAAGWDIHFEGGEPRDAGVSFVELLVERRKLKARSEVENLPGAVIEPLDLLKQLVLEAASALGQHRPVILFLPAPAK